MKKVNWVGLMGWTIGLLILLMLTYIGITQWRFIQKPKPINKAWQTFTRHLAKLGQSTSETECPSNFQQRISQQNPDIATGTGSIIKYYLDLRYGKKVGKVKEFEGLVKRFIAMT
ncbi:hypothetical protein PN36_03285 [Candidatus Thiomargarita nelsonii]|uniref:Uncharacterized protein n=1 Tax=Candidatus Thiomargarita nelsonii TaxID=1003181 RepID=A0A4E0QSG5_9GAMM|nr:hypothetical protein PN36_03285 [Candidatus Thiomargarita nelsonii]